MRLEGAAMVKLGFIGEGKTERMILESEHFRALLTILNLDYVESKMTIN